MLGTGENRYYFEACFASVEIHFESRIDAQVGAIGVMHFAAEIAVARNYSNCCSVSDCC